MNIMHNKTEKCIMQLGLRHATHGERRNTE